MSYIEIKAYCHLRNILRQADAAFNDSNYGVADGYYSLVDNEFMNKRQLFNAEIARREVALEVAKFNQEASNA